LHVCLVGQSRFAPFFFSFLIVSTAHLQGTWDDSLPPAVAKNGSTHGGAPPPGDVEAGTAGARRSRVRDTSLASDVTVEHRESTPL